ncbi:DUF1847 domain-containing protein [Heliobacillus mobilis]|uniref:DUF1847 domain-containing protein n=1 Tax=Heliobacterium mobile TaxID=28064 RepID=A0A6I3SHD9_HELMO|nr:DUF1847 domain-containing protein [Heliobacterium mobile]MTV48283.1 DUF1847 domain-containing protein [Heliobacterium mobile]
MTMDTKKLSCSDCGQFNCYRQDKEFPRFCLTTEIEADELERIKELYRTDEWVSKLAYAAADIEGTYYGKLTRVEEIIAFAKHIGAKKIGIATCIGLIEEAKTFVKILRAKGLEPYSVICKVGSVDKTEVGVPEEKKVKTGCFEALCNPVLQAEILNREQTELNVIIGLCVGHDSLFIKYSQAPVTTLITKDRVLGHNPAAALYTTGFYYKRLLEPEKE